MSLESVERWLAANAPDLRLIEVAETTATVESAAKALGVEPGRIAKTLAIRAGDQLFLLVARGDARLDNRKCKDEFGARPRMLGPEETLEATGHPVGGVCPFGLKQPLPVYLDVSLRAFDVSIRRAGRSTPRSKFRPVACSSSWRTAGSTYAGCPAKRRGPSSPALTPATGQDVPAISDSAIRAMMGEVWRPKPPCPASQKKPSASGAKPAAGRRSGVNVRSPAQRLWTRPTLTVVRSSIRWAASATSYSSGWASHGSLGTSSMGEANNRPLSGAK
jgi:prolyl-tRNA editing enzyme YbaK/EbsC (Cys-tRNA(Pro) deacylase)